MELSLLIDAIDKTFTNRNSLNDLVNAQELIHIFRDDETLNRLWKKYQQSHHYAVGITSNNVIETIENILLALDVNKSDKENQNDLEAH